jgi:competence protein ComEA
MKGIKRTASFIKQYFVFSRTERKGIYALLLLIAIALATPRLWVVAFPPEILQLSISELPEEQEKNNTLVASGEKASIQPIRLFYFNPNKVDSATFVELGFSPRTARSIIRYRNKGGRFRNAGDLYKIYNTDSSFIAQLIPYVQIPEEARAENKPFENRYQAKEPKKTVLVEMNTADSLTLVSLYGIGPRLASKIIAYRGRSGGFFRLEQLTEVFGIDQALLDELKGKIYVDPGQVRYININEVTFEELKQHPYLRYRTANAIINYRRQHGAFSQVEDLKKIVILPDSTYNKLLPYLRLN